MRGRSDGFNGVRIEKATENGEKDLLIRSRTLGETLPMNRFLTNQVYTTPRGCWPAHMQPPREKVWPFRIARTKRKEDLDNKRRKRTGKRRSIGRVCCDEMPTTGGCHPIFFDTKQANKIKRKKRKTRRTIRARDRAEFMNAARKTSSVMASSFLSFAGQ